MENKIKKLLKIILVPIVAPIVIFWILIKAISRLHITIKGRKVKISFLREKKRNLEYYYKNINILNLFKNLIVYESKYDNDSSIERLFNEYHYTPGRICCEDGDIHMNASIENKEHYMHVLGHEIGHYFLYTKGIGGSAVRFAEIETFCDFYGSLLISLETDKNLLESISVSQNFLLERNKLSIKDLFDLNPFDERKIRFSSILDLKFKMDNLNPMEIFNKLNEMSEMEIREFIFVK